MTIWLYILLAAVALMSGYRIWRRLRHFLHVFQLEGYKTAEFRKWLGGRGTRQMFCSEHLAGFVVIGLLLTLTQTTDASWPVFGALLAWLLFLGSARKYRSDESKKRLKFTPRMRRLAGVAVFLALTVLAGTMAVLSGFGFGLIAVFLASLLVADVIAPFVVVGGGYCIRPMERIIQDGFKRQAHEKLQARDDLTVIGITGSYGKTSVKFATAEILSQRFKVLATPGSYNTPMGICKVVNNDLRPIHQYLILEMGARYPGDIKELCDIAQPDVAVLTSIGVAHLETMGSPEAILSAKGELVRHMKSGGPIVANMDDDGVMQIVRESSSPVTTVSIKKPTADVAADQISYGLDGCRFVVTMGDERQEMQAGLLGAHNVTNILLGIGIGQLFGLRLRQMKHAVSRLRPVPHRLQLRAEGAITVIDDSFNSNPVGARNAVEILGRFDTGKRVIVTPGMVELGDRQDEENRSLGAFMAGHVDLAVLVGQRQTEPIREGLLDAGYPEDAIVVCRSLFEARDLLQDRLTKGDVVLYENDLPDQYDEPA